MTNNSDNLVAIVYSSDAVGHVDDRQLTALLEQARAKNATLEITGILIYRGERFIQYLEGPEADVRNVYRAICDDPRHEHLRLLFDGPLETRRFSDWTMGYEPLRETGSDARDSVAPDSAAPAGGSSTGLLPSGLPTNSAAHTGLPPVGFRNTFDDLENTEHPDQVLRAVSELTVWYHARALRV